MEMSDEQWTPEAALRRLMQRQEDNDASHRTTHPGETRVYLWPSVSADEDLAAALERIATQQRLINRYEDALSTIADTLQWMCDTSLENGCEKPCLCSCKDAAVETAREALYGSSSITAEGDTHDDVRG